MAQPFLVIATQNPVEHHGTYPLPESQLDRFLMRLKIGYPDRESERAIVRNHALERASQMRPVLTREELLGLQAAVEKIRVDESLVSYMLGIVDETRKHDQLALGVSPRAAQALYRASQALAMIEERDYVIPDDIKRLAVPVFAHRVVMHQRSGLAARSSEAAERVIEEILSRIEVPL
jgi:MoxR-like ATPase